MANSRVFTSNDILAKGCYNIALEQGETNMASLSGNKTEQYEPGELVEVRIRPSSNGGAEVYCEYTPSKSQQKGGLCYQPSKPATFTSVKEAVAHAAKELGTEEKKES